MKEIMRWTVVSLLVVAIIGCGKESKPKGDPKGDEGKATEGKPTEGKPTEGKPTTPAKDTAMKPVTLTKPADDAENKAAAELAVKLLDPAQQNTEVKNPANARLFVVLAATSTDAKVMAQALSGISKTFGSGKAEFDDDAMAVVAARLAEKDHALLAPAVLAARVAVKGDTVNEALAAAIAALISRDSDPSAQFAGLETPTDAYRKQAAVSGAILAALDSKADHVVAQALASLGHFADSKMKDADKFKAKAEALLSHANPSVRGEACDLLARMAPWGDKEAAKAIGTKVLPLLDDADPFPKSRAAAALASVKYKPGVHAIMKHLDDKRKNTTDNKDWKTIWGKSGWDHHDGSPWSRVDDAMLGAIESMTFFDDDKKKFKYDVGSKTVDADIAKAVVNARKWYDKNKAGIPAE